MRKGGMIMAVLSLYWKSLLVQVTFKNKCLLDASYTN